MTTLIALLALGAASYALRAVLLCVVPVERLPARVRSGLEYLAPAALAALVTAEVQASVAGAEITTTVAVLATVAVIALAVRVTRSLPLAMAIGLAGALLIDLV